MNRILSTLLSTALIINILGCTSSPSNKEVSKLALKTDEITDVKLLNVKENNTVKAETNNKGFIVQMLKSIQAGKPKEVSLTKQTMESVSSKMENSNATSTKGVQIQHDLKTPMIVLNFIKQ
ncbi:hypothetical protein ACFMB7_09680 [Bacillus toyonensis]